MPFICFQISVALEAWSLYQTWSNCEKLADKVDDAADDIKKAYDDNVDLNVTVTKYLENITYVSAIVLVIRVLALLTRILILIVIMVEMVTAS